MTTPARCFEPRVAPAGDAALLVELGEGIDEAVNRRVHALARAIDEARVAGVLDVVPTYRSLLVCYDPLALDFERVRSTVADVARSLDTASLPAPTQVEIPTCYRGEFGPDLAFVASHNKLTPEDVVAIHASGTYTVYMMGFSPGFAYLGGMSPAIAAPRLKTPRTAIPAGSVGIAQQQTGIYPVESPGGWQLIGRTPVQLFDVHRVPPTAVQPGDVIRFVPIDEEKYRELEQAGRPGAEAPGTHKYQPLEQAERAGAEAPGRHTLADVVGPPGFSPGAPAQPSIEILSPGGLTTIQDLGRYGFQRYGVPVSGALDTFALRIANLLVGNDERAAALEMTITGPEILFHQPAVAAITGADMQPRIDEAYAPTWAAFEVPAGGVLSFRGLRAGARAYLAVAGGIDVPTVLGSRSTYLRSGFGGLHGRPLQAGDRLAVSPSTRGIRRLDVSSPHAYMGSHRVRVVLGPQHDAFTSDGITTLLSSAYTVGPQSDRMGYRLEGPRIEHRSGADIVSDGTPAGAVQVAGDGLPLILLADRGTTGGYAKIATVISADLPRVAQCRPGDRMFFDAVTVAQAHAALRTQDEVIARLRRTAPVAPVATGIVFGHRQGAAQSRAAGSRSIARAPLPGKILQVKVEAGNAVERGQALCVLEAMKMHNTIGAARAGHVAAVHVKPGDQVTDGQALVEIE